MLFLLFFHYKGVFFNLKILFIRQFIISSQS